MKLELVPKLAQQQVLSPKMLLSMKVLPLTNAELELQLAEEVAENPALEFVQEPVEQEQPAAKPDAVTSALRLFQPYQESTGRPRYNGEDGDDFFADVPSRPQGLAGHLQDQLNLMELTAQVRTAADEIIGNLDWRGYLLFSREDIEASLPEELQPHFASALSVVQGLDPAGVGAEDVRECLLLQFQRLPGPETIAETIVRDHFDLLVSNRIPQLAETLTCSIDEVQEELASIAGLSLRPGAPFLNDEPGVIRPDVMIEDGEHGYQIQVHNEGVPRLQLSETCRQLLAKNELDPEAVSYLKKKIESAQWLIQALEGRRRTLKDIAEAVMEYQRGFLNHGPGHLTPLRMQTVADAVGVHVSTVSRAVKGKYIQTPWGTYPLRYFFGGGVPDSAGSLTSRQILKDKITDIIAKEDKRTPLSDGDLAAKLRAQGFRISRRTVSKYRCSVNIPPAKLRKVF